MRKSVCGLAMTAMFIVAPLVARAAPDFSEPRKTMLTLQQAVQAHDSKTLRACFDTTGTTKVAQIYLDAWDATFRFQDAMENKFGLSGAEAVRSTKPYPSLADAQTHWEDAGTLTVNGDTATLALEGNPGANPPAEPAQIHFKRADGLWKIDGASLVNVDDPKTADRLKLMSQVTDAMKKVTEEINSGKILAAQEAQQTLVQRVIAILHPPTATPAPPPTSKAPATTHAAGTQ
jgi:hypothetical protein